MSVIFNICLPVETIAALQRGESEPILTQLGNTIPDGQYHLIHDITRNVVTAVSAIPCSILPKALPTTLSAKAPAFSPSWGSPICPPDSPPYSSVPVCLNGRSKKPEIGITFRDLMNKEEYFSVNPDITIQDLKGLFAKRISTAISSLAFTWKDGSPLAPSHDGNITIQSIGIWDSDTFFVKPSSPESADITLVFQHAMMKEQKIITTKTTAICDLIDHYVQHTGVNLWDFHVTCGFMNLMEIAQEACPEDTLDQLGITTGSVIRVAPPQDITVTFRDQMLKEEHITRKETDDFRSFVSQYLDATGYASSSVYYTLNGGSELWAWNMPGRALGIADGDVINVHPRAVPPVTARAESVASS